MTAIWETFLTEQDKESLQHISRERRGFGTKPAVVLIDLYRGAFGEYPLPIIESAKLWPGSCGTVAWEALPHIKRLLSAARELSLPVVHVTYLEDSDSGIEGWNTQGRARVEGESVRAPMPGRYEFMPDLAPQSGEAIVRKSAPSAFWGTPLIGHLRSLGVDTVVVAGQSTSGCVRATVVDARANRLKAIVLGEGCFDRHEASHAIGLFDMHQKYADVLELNEVLERLSATN